MLAIKCTPNIFLLVPTSLPPPFNKIFDTLKWVCWKIISYSVFIGAGYGIYLFLFLTYIFTRYSRNIHEKKFGPAKIPLRKYFDPRNTQAKTFWTHEIHSRKNFEPTMYLRERFFDPRRHGGRLTRDLRGPWWHVTHGI